jgi:hypothetical protein
MQKREMGLQDEQIRKADEVSRYGVTLSPVIRSLETAYRSYPQQELARLSQYSGDLAKRINELSEIAPNSPDIPILQSMRAMKILSDPTLLAKFGGEYGMQSTAINSASVAIEERLAKQAHDVAINNLEIIEKKLQNEKYVGEIEKIKVEMKKLDYEAKYKEAEAVASEYKALQEKIKTTYLPEQLKEDINKVVAQAGQARASAQASQASAQASLASASNSYASADERRNSMAIDNMLAGGKSALLQAQVQKEQKSVNKMDYEIEKVKADVVNSTLKSQTDSAKNNAQKKVGLLYDTFIKDKSDKKVKDSSEFILKYNKDLGKVGGNKLSADELKMFKEVVVKMGEKDVKIGK